MIHNGWTVSLEYQSPNQGCDSVSRPPYMLKHIYTSDCISIRKEYKGVITVFASDPGGKLTSDPNHSSLTHT